MCYGTAMSLFADENRKYGKAFNRMSGNRYSKPTPQETPQEITPTPQETEPTTPKPTTTSRQNLTIQ